VVKRLSVLFRDEDELAPQVKVEDVWVTLAGVIYLLLELELQLAVCRVEECVVVGVGELIIFLQLFYPIERFRFSQLALIFHLNARYFVVRNYLKLPWWHQNWLGKVNEDLTFAGDVPDLS
jgi:hypothetical protein